MSKSMRTPYPVQNSTLSAGALAADLAGIYPLETPVACAFFRKGICDTYRVRAGTRQSFFKVYRHGRRAKLDVEEEVRLLLHLTEDSVSVAEPIRRSDGSFTVAFDAPEGTRYGVLFRAAEGELDDGVFSRFAARIRYFRADLTDHSVWSALAHYLSPVSGLPQNIAFYMAIRPAEFGQVTENLARHGLLEQNKLSNAYYGTTWNSYIYNTVDGDPLQISETIPAVFLNLDSME